MSWMLHLLFPADGSEIVLFWTSRRPYRAFGTLTLTCELRGLLDTARLAKDLEDFLEYPYRSKLLGEPFLVRAIVVLSEYYWTRCESLSCL
jgi:hypothetical protein